jgi:membrane protease YdiL (CAAX protease family)
MKSKWLFIGLILLYLIPSFSFDFLFDFWQVGLTPYLFELFFILIAISIFKNKFKITSANGKTKHYLRYLAGGFITIIFCKLFGTKIPFDLNSGGIIVLLILIAPLLEELIFRFSLWQCFESLDKTKKYALILTSSLFSLAHFKSVLLIAPGFLTFVTFQSVYTLILGHRLGLRYQKNRNVLEVIILHMLFNLGFLIGFKGIY